MFCFQGGLIQGLCLTWSKYVLPSHTMHNPHHPQQSGRTPGSRTSSKEQASKLGTSSGTTPARNFKEQLQPARNFRNLFQARNQGTTPARELVSRQPPSRNFKETPASNLFQAGNSSQELVSSNQQTPSRTPMPNL